MRMTQFAALSLAMSWHGAAIAGTEYVNPVFCYRVVTPPGTFHIVSDYDGNDVVFAPEAPCGGHACSTLEIAAGYAWNTARAPHSHAWFLAHGWAMVRSGRRAGPVLAWEQFQLARGGEGLTTAEFVGGREAWDHAAYVVSARYTTASAVAGARSLTRLLNSWRWVSACL